MGNDDDDIHQTEDIYGDEFTVTYRPGGNYEITVQDTSDGEDVDATAVLTPEQVRSLATVLARHVGDVARRASRGTSMRFQVEFDVPDDDPLRVVFVDEGLSVVVPEGQRLITFSADQEDVLRAVLNARAEKGALS